MMSLSQIADNVGTDKGPNCHKFTDYYQKVFGHLKRRKKLSVLEIGVFSGASIEMWAQFFGEKARIYGIDIEDLHELPVFTNYSNTTFIQADQCKEDELLKAVAATGQSQFDLIIDDGAHTLESQFITLKTLYPFVKINSYYVLEDLHTSYLTGYMGKDDPYRYSPLRFLLEGVSDSEMDIPSLQEKLSSITIVNCMPFQENITGILRF